MADVGQKVRAIIAEQLGVQDKAQRFLGRGSQAREYARVVTEALGVKASG